MSKIELTDSGMDIAFKMSEGNPGALTFIMEMLNSGNDLDLMRILHFDTYEVYGSKLYMVWNDCCDRNLDTVRLLCKNLQFGKITKEELHTNLNRGRALPFELISEKKLMKSIRR